MSNESRTPAQLADDIRRALEAGTVEPSEIERLLAARGKQRITFSSVIFAIGICIAYAGGALLYAVNFDALNDVARLVSPFSFATISLGIAAVLSIKRRPSWELESAFGIGYISLAAAVATSTLAYGGSRDTYLALLSLACSLLISAAIRSLPGRVVISYWALCIALAACVVAAGWILGIQEDELRWSWLAVGLGGLAAGILVLRRGVRRAAGASMALGTVGLVIASVVGSSQGAAFDLSPWHAVLTLTVVTAILGGAYLRLPEVAAAGGIGSLLWFGTAIELVSREPAWAVAVILFGVILAAATAGTMKYAPGA